MTPEQFAYWLKGFCEMHEGKNISERQWQIINDHLNLVFDKQTPERPATPILVDKPSRARARLLNEGNRKVCSSRLLSTAIREESGRESV